MTLEALLASWKADPSISQNITAWQILPVRTPTFTDFPGNIEPVLLQILQELGITSLYKHQSQAWDSLDAGRNVILSTGTASGKSLAYQLPLLNNLLSDPCSKGLLLYPTKALARDQLNWFDRFPFAKAYPYDGDTPQHIRKNIRENANLIISNPDMLHLGILPYHTNWIEFFQNLKYVVLDEIHIYRGVFGSHVANVLRRFKRLTAHYGSQPQFIFTSATIGNPLELAESLIAEEFELISHDYSGQGVKHILFYNPPVIDHNLGIRASTQGECIRLASDLISTGMQTIIFSRSRRSVEFLYSSLKRSSKLPESSLQSYRSGYLPSHRREIESRLRSGEIRCITATTALELGIDIGGLDASILAGYPGTIAGTWQQAGRSGRSDNASLALLVASSNPLDQYLAQHPEFLFGKNPENGLIDPDNLLITLAHLGCAAYELPFSTNSRYGNYTVAETQELLDLLKGLGKLHFSSNNYYWIHNEYPASTISLRTTSPDQISLFIDSQTSPDILLGTIDYESSLWMVHPGAVYLHSGESYLVKNLDLDQRKAQLIPFSGTYYTEPQKNMDFCLLQLREEERLPGGDKHYGEIIVNTQVIGYKKINWDYYEILSQEPLELPSTDLKTMGVWLTLSENMESTLRGKDLWTSSPNQYGPNWELVRKLVLERDHYICAHCGRPHSETPLHVHHKIPLRSFPSYDEANRLPNLVALCPQCHRKAETIVRVNSGIRGLGHILHHLSPLLLMCDPGDLGVHTDFNSPLGGNRPVALIYEQIPAGIGFSRHLYQQFSNLLEMSLQAVLNCQCQDGCPSCVGPGGVQGSGGKPETLAILSVLCDHDIGSDIK